MRMVFHRSDPVREGIAHEGMKPISPMTELVNALAPPTLLVATESEAAAAAFKTLRCGRGVHLPPQPIHPTYP